MSSLFCALDSTTGWHCAL